MLHEVGSTAVVKKKCLNASVIMHAECVPSHCNHKRSRIDSTSSYVVLQETTNQKQGIKSSNGKEETEKQRIIAKKQENYRNEYVRSVSHDGNYLERRVNKCHQSLCIHRVIQFLVLLSALAALAIVILIVFGVLAPAGCPCNKTGERPVLLCCEVFCRVVLAY